MHNAGGHFQLRASSQLDTKSNTMYGRPMKLIERRKLLRLMADKEVSARQLAHVAGYYSHTHIQRVLRGERDGVNADAARAIAQLLGVTLDDLFVPEMSNELDGQSNRKDEP